MKSYAGELAVLMLALAAAGQPVAPRNLPFPPQRPPHYVSSRGAVEAYAATNPTFGPAMEYVLSTLDGHQPEHLPEGVSPADLTNALLKVFPNAVMAVDQPISFYGRVLDESNQPVAGAIARFEWRGFLIHGRRAAEARSDAAGRFGLTNELGQELSVSVGKSDYYSSVRNRGAGWFHYTATQGAPFQPDPRQPVLYYLHKKGVGASSLVTSDYGVYRDFPIQAPRNGTPVKVDLLHRKLGAGPLEIIQLKPEYAQWKTATNWSLCLKLADGGFIEEHEEFPFHPPLTGYQPVVEFKFEKGQTNWSNSVRKDFYIKFGSPALYGRLSVEDEVSSGAPRLAYVINPDGARNLEPRNENTPPTSPVLKTKTKPGSTLSGPE